MKIYRLIGIITTLLQNEKATAPELAKKFEVSRRTINRDIEDICKAGIPIVTARGANGGISIMDSYKIEKSLLSEEDFRSIFASLSALDSVSQNKKYKNIIDKFISKKDSCLLRNNILIDLSSHYKDTLAPKIELLQSCIDDGNTVSFLYCNKHGEHFVTADPYLIVFQWSSWYLLAFHHASEEFKLYKLNRILNLQNSSLRFTLRPIPPEKLDFNGYFTNTIHPVIFFDKSEEYRLIEEYGKDSYFVMPDGRLRFSVPFTNEDYLINWVLSFGEKATLTEPTELCAVIKNRLEKALENYVRN